MRPGIDTAGEEFPPGHKPHQCQRVTVRVLELPQLEIPTNSMSHQSDWRETLPMNNYVQHEFGHLIPEPTSEEFEELTASIKATEPSGATAA